MRKTHNTPSVANEVSKNNNQATPNNEVVKRSHLDEVLDKVKYNNGTWDLGEFEITVGDLDPLCMLSQRVLFVDEKTHETKFRKRFVETNDDNPSYRGIKGKKLTFSALWWVSYCVTKQGVNAQRKTKDEYENEVLVPMRNFPSAIVSASRRLEIASGHADVDDWRALVALILLRELKAGNRVGAIDKARSALYEAMDGNARLPDKHKTLPKEEICELDTLASNEELRSSVLGEDWAERLANEVSKRKGKANLRTPCDEVEELRSSSDFESDFDDTWANFLDEVKENRGKYWGLSRWYAIFANSENIANCEIAKQLDLSQAAVSKNITESQSAFYGYAIEKEFAPLKTAFLSYAKKYLASLMRWLVGETNEIPKMLHGWVLSRRERKTIKDSKGRKTGTELVPIFDEVKAEILKGWVLDEVKKALNESRFTEWGDILDTFNDEVIEKLIAITDKRN